MDTVKITIIGAGSACFCPGTVADILFDEKFAKIKIKLTLMDIDEKALSMSASFAREAVSDLNRDVEIIETTNLQRAVDGADFVVTAIEVDRYHYWSMDFHIPRRFGFRQVYGENGGPGGMFHFLRNVGPILDIAKAMEDGCPDAWLLNYTNPEAKLIESISKMSSIKAVGLCHGEMMGVAQLSRFLEIPVEELDTEACGLNHFGWFTKIKHKKSGEDLYPLLRLKEREADYLTDWDEYALSRVLLRTFGLWPYPGSNHIGEYMGWSDDFVAGALIQYYYDPASENPWKERKTPEFIYSFSQNPTERGLFDKKNAGKNNDAGDPGFNPYVTKENFKSPSGEYGIKIARSIYFDEPMHIGAVNMPNVNQATGILKGMAVETPAKIDGKGIHPIKTDELPLGIVAMINQQGAIHDLLIRAYKEKSRNFLLQALLIDPCISSYANAVELINTMFEKQSEILPDLKWLR